MEGKRILRVETRRKDLRFPFPENFSQRIGGARVNRLGRRAKYLVGELSTGEALIMHLGMTGRFTIAGSQAGRFHHPAGEAGAHDHVIFGMEGGGRIVFNDARRFGFMDLWPLSDIGGYAPFRQMGPEPVSAAFSGAYLKAAFEGRRTPVKAALLDQAVVAGLGNIYVCEALFRAGIRPTRPAGALSRPRLVRLAGEITKVIEEAIEAGGSTISDFGRPDGELGYFQHRFQIYDREGEPCRACSKPVRRIVQSGRSSFYCTTCQR